VILGGEDATRLSPQNAASAVFQHYAAFKHMTVRDNVGFALKIRKRSRTEIRTRVDELLELVQLQGFGHRYPAQLSGGQRQRMALARALAAEPEVLLLDEPFGALDARVRHELRAWLRRLHEETHTTTVFVTHDQEEAMEVADTVVVMNKGRVEQAAPPRVLYDAPANEFVMSFVGQANRFGDGWVRPHDLQVTLEPGGRRASTDRTARPTSATRCVPTDPRRRPAPRSAYCARRSVAALSRAGPDRLRQADARDRLRLSRA
jgi:sulfate transport system ATP-binding protein